MTWEYSDCDARYDKGLCSACNDNPPEGGNYTCKSCNKEYRMDGLPSPFPIWAEKKLASRAVVSQQSGDIPIPELARDHNGWLICPKCKKGIEYAEANSDGSFKCGECRSAENW